MNLYEMYKTNETAEKDGVWFDISDEVGFKIKKFGGSNSKRIQKLQAKYLKPYAQMIKRGAMDEKLERQLYIKVFAESCLVEWKGVVDQNDKDMEYSVDNAVKLFTDLPNLFDDLVSFATSDENYKDDLGNS